MARKKTTIVSILLVLLLVTALLLQPATVSADAPVADFGADVSLGPAPLTVSFVSLSTGEPTSFSWDFGDGATSTQENPTHIYTTGGSFTVKLTATNTDGSSTETKTGLISVIRADYSASATSGTAPLTVTFTDASEGTVESRLWDLDGDGITDSTDQNPSFTYTTGGTFSPKLTVIGGAGSDDEVKTDHITVFEIPVVEFSADVTSGLAPLAVTFSDLSTGNPTSFSWDFGDGSTSTAQNPTHTYTTGGNFTVKLTATNSAGSASKTKTTFIRTLKGGFTAAPTGGTIPFTVNFTDQSTGTIDSRSWDFDNDGIADSTEQNPSFQYTSAGMFTVSLAITGAAGSQTVTRTDFITALQAPVANFSADVTSGAAPLAVTFTDQSTGNPTSFSWNFGDGTTSTAQNPTHTYTSGGNFNVSLTATNAVGADTETKSTFVRTIKSDFTASTTPAGADTDPGPNVSGIAPLTVNFNTAAQGTSEAFAWDFNGDGIIDSTQQQPSFQYTAGGDFTVALRVTGPAGSSTETKSGFVKVFQLPVADFSANVTSGIAPLTVNFTDQSTGNPTSFAWDFDTATDSDGDGTADNDADSTAQNPSHTYNTGGDFSVKLTATNSVGSDTETKTAFIRTIKSAFTADTTSGNTPLTVNFTSQAQGTVSSFAWDFNGDGATDSTQQNPSFQYTAGGNFTVSLKVTGPAGSPTETKTNFISVFQLPVADFSANTTSGTAPLAVTFTDQSTGNPTSFAWDFDTATDSDGDGTADNDADSTAQNPSHTYNTGGDFTVKLTATNAVGSDSETKTTFIRAIKSAFTADVTSGTVSAGNPLTVTFTDQSAGTVTAYAWDFNGDGNIDSTQQNPSFQYTTGGNFTVSLRVTGPAGSSTETKTSFISVVELPVSDFSADETTGEAPFTVSFTNLATGNPTAFAWNFGDGSTSTAQNPAHVFTTGSDFDVTLTVTNSAGSDGETKTDFIRTIKSDFTADTTSGNATLTVNFTSQAQGTVSSFAWDFNADGVIDSTQQNPSFQYTTGGNFTVSLRVIGPAGSSTETKAGFISVFQAPTADFSASVNAGAAPLTVTFTDQSTGNPTSWAWDFNEDGVTDSTAQNPTTTFTSGGNFDIKLTATNAAGSGTETKTDFIKVIKSEFTGTPTSGNAPLTVNFTSQAQGSVDSFAWDFNGDGIIDSSQQNPSFQYTSAGSFTVALRVVGAAGSSTKTKTGFISVFQLPAADFSADVTGGAAPLTVTFTDQSTGNPTSFAWTFGDGTTSTAQSPTHTYTTGGDFTVTLTATNAAGSNLATKANFIRTLVSDFTPSTAQQGSPPLAVNFTAQTQGTVTSYTWDFGTQVDTDNDLVADSQTSTAQNPSVNYLGAGTFTVSLTVTGPGGTDIETKTNLVRVAGALSSATVTPSPVTVQAGSTTQFTATALDELGIAISGLTPQWSVVAGGGSISQTGSFTAGTQTGTFTNTVQAKFTQGITVVTATATVQVIEAAVVPPGGEVPVVAPPSAPTNLTIDTPQNDDTPSFSWGPPVLAPGIVSFYEVQVDAAAFVAIGSGTAFTVSDIDALSDGSHSFTVRAQDTRGQTGDSATVSFTIDATAPEVPASFVKTTPDKDNTPTFTWDPPLEEGTGVNFYEFQVDGGGFSNIGNVTTYTVPDSQALDDGGHTVQVRAVDKATNVGAEASLTFQVDATPPSAPAGLQRTTPDDDNTPTFEWTASTDATSGVASYEARIDDASFQDIGNVTTYTVPDDQALADGSHTFQVRAIDGAGNRSDSASLTFELEVEVVPTPTPGPTPTPTPEPTPTPIPTAIVPPETVIEELLLPTAQVIGADITGTDDKGNTVSSTGDPIKISELQDKLSTISLPLAVASGNSLESFSDPETGISVTRVDDKTRVSIPVTDAEGVTQMTLTVTVDQLVGTGTTAEAIIERIDVETTEKAKDFSVDDPDVGEVSASLSSQLTRIPDNATITVTLSKIPPDEAFNAFSLVAQEEGTTIKDIAFSIAVDKTNLVEGEDLVQGFITMKVGKAWMDRVGIGNVRVLRLGDDGGREVLQTSFLGFDSEGKGIFRGFSPRGLSIFGLAALEKPPEDTAEVTIGPLEAGTITSIDGTVRILVTENPLEEFLRVSLKTVFIGAAPAAAPEGFGIVGNVFVVDLLTQDREAIPDLVFEKPVQITVTYSPEDVQKAEADESKLTLARFDPSSSEWVLLLTDVNVDQNTATVTVDRLSFFALLGEGAVTPVTPLPGVGDVTPPMALIVASLLAGLLALASGVYLLRRSRRRKAEA